MVVQTAMHRCDDTSQIKCFKESGHFLPGSPSPEIRSIRLWNLMKRLSKRIAFWNLRYHTGDNGRTSNNTMKVLHQWTFCLPLITCEGLNKNLKLIFLTMWISQE